MYSRALLYIPSTIRVATKSQSRSLSTFNFTSRRDVVPSTLWSIRNFSDAAVSVASSDASPSQIQELSSSLDADVKKAEGPADAPIPSLPPKNLTSLVTQDDIDNYIKPLYRRKWVVKWNNRQLRPEKYTTYLGKTFKLNDYDATMDFVKDIAKIVREENHHPEIAYDFDTVKVQTQTHFITGSTVATEQLPGISPNDARLAIRIERLFAHVYLDSGRGRFALNSENVPGQTPETLEGIKKVKPWEFKSKQGRYERLRSGYSIYRPDVIF